jgi:hypothetical protein
MTPHLIGGTVSCVLGRQCSFDVSYKVVLILDTMRLLFLYGPVLLNPASMWDGRRDHTHLLRRAKCRTLVAYSANTHKKSQLPCLVLTRSSSHACLVRPQLDPTMRFWESTILILNTTPSQLYLMESEPNFLGRERKIRRYETFIRANM